MRSVAPGTFPAMWLLPGTYFNKPEATVNRPFRSASWAPTAVESSACASGDTNPTGRESLNFSCTITACSFTFPLVTDGSIVKNHQS